MEHSLATDIIGTAATTLAPLGRSAERRNPDLAAGKHLPV